MQKIPISTGASAPLDVANMVSALKSRPVQFVHETNEVQSIQTGRVAANSAHPPFLSEQSMLGSNASEILFGTPVEPRQLPFSFELPRVSGFSADNPALGSLPRLVYAKPTNPVPDTITMWEDNRQHAAFSYYMGFPTAFLEQGETHLSRARRLAEMYKIADEFVRTLQHLKYTSHYFPIRTRRCHPDDMLFAMADLLKIAGFDVHPLRRYPCE